MRNYFKYRQDIQISNENEALVKIGTSMHRRANGDFSFRREEEIFYNCLVKGNRYFRFA